MKKRKKILTLLLSVALICGVMSSMTVVSASDLGDLTVTYSGGGVYNVSATVDLANAEEFSFFATSYDDEGYIIGLKKQNVIAQAGSGVTAQTSFDFSSDAYINKAYSTLFFMWNSYDYKPIRNATVYNRELGVTEVAGGKTAYGEGDANQSLYSWSGNSNDGTNAGKIVDGNDASTVGFFGNNFGNTGFMYIDLGDAYKIDRIDILAYNAASYHRAGQFDIILGNTAPSGQAAETGDYTVAENTEDDSNAKTADVGYKSYYPGSSNEYRYVSLKKYGGKDGLCIAEVKVYVKNEDMPSYTEVAQGKYAGRLGTTSGILYDYSTTSYGISAASINDGNDDTRVGFEWSAGKVGCMYVDLGQPYMIDHIDILAYDGQYPRAGDFDIVIGNYGPDGAAYDPNNTIGEVLVEHVPWDTAATSKDIGYKSYKVTGGGSYRFVSLEKFQSTSYGMFIAEVKVYVKDSNMPASTVTYTDAASGKTTGGWQDGNAAYTFTNFPTANLVDGNESTGAGFYYNNSSPCNGYVYIDLGAQHKIDHIDIVSYDAVRPGNANGFNVLASNALPDQTAYDPSNPGGEVFLGKPAALNSQTTADMGRNRFYMPAGGGSCRYVILEQLQQTTNGYGLMVQDVKVYVKDSEMPVNVALGAASNANSAITTGGWYSTFNNAAYITDGSLFSENSGQVITANYTIYRLDLGAEYMITDLLVDVVIAGGNPANIRISSTDNFNTATSVISDTSAWSDTVRTFTFATPIRGRYIYFHTNRGNMRLGEVKAFGTPAE